jgi:hypothetical protein
MRYNQFPDIEIPAFLQAEGWKDVSYHNEEAPRSEFTYPEDFGYHLYVFVFPEDGHFLIWTTSDEDNEPLEEDEAANEAEAMDIIKTHKWILDVLLENAQNRDNPNYEGPKGLSL